MKSLSLTAVLTAFFACGTALGAHARDGEKISQQGLVSVEVSSEGKSWQDFNVLSVSTVPTSIAEEEETAKRECTITLTRTCPNGTTVTATATAETCAEAGGTAGSMIDAGCSGKLK